VINKEKEASQVVTKSAFFQARKQLSYKAFIELNRQIIDTTYKWKKAPLSAKAEEDKALTEVIKTSFNEGRECYGTRLHTARFNRSRTHGESPPYWPVNEDRRNAG
jgi:hypothetical protein